MRHAVSRRKLTATLSALGLPLVAISGLAACTVPAKPVLACSVAVSPKATLLDEPETVTVKTAPGAIAMTSVRYPGAAAAVKSVKADSKGLARFAYSSGAHSGKVSVVALVAKSGSTARQCSALFAVVNGTFALTQKPACPQGTAVFRSPNVPAIVKWRIAGVTGVTLTVDGGPGIYESYGPADSQEFNFSCSGPIGSTESHTYTLTTTGGVILSETLKASASIIDNGGHMDVADPTG